MNIYEFIISESLTLNGKVIALAASIEEAEAKLRAATFNGERFVKWDLTNIRNVTGSSEIPTSNEARKKIAAAASR